MVMTGLSGSQNTSSKDINSKNQFNTFNLRKKLKNFASIDRVGEEAHFVVMVKSAAKKMKGRGTATFIDPRYLSFRYEDFDDGWETAEEDKKIKTTVTVEKPRTVISRNRSPDIPFEISLNPYRGCEHGCIYCYARPTHAYMDLSPGIEFESKLFVKPGAPDLLRKELGRKGYRCTPLAMGTNTDPYQPVEREWKITRGIIEVLHECRHPLTIVTKSCLVERDLDLLTPMAEQGLVQIFVSVTTLDHDLARRLEPRAASPARRLETLRRLVSAGVPAGVMFAPVIPFINDAEMEAVLESAARAGVEAAGYVMLRLPFETKHLFREWLQVHEPLKADHVMGIINDLREGKDNDPEFHARMRGKGVFARLIRHRFEQACRKLELNRTQRSLAMDKFRPPLADVRQQSLF